MARVGLDATCVRGGGCHAGDPAKPVRLRLAAGNAVVSANVLEHAVIEVDDQTGADQPIVIYGNLLQNSELVHRKGKVIRSAVQAGPE